MQELTQVELTSLKAYRQVYDNIVREFGNIAILQKDLESRRKNAESALDENRLGQQEYLKSLQDKYGAGRLDLERGLFIPASQPNQVQEESKVDEEPPKKKRRTTRKKS